MFAFWQLGLMFVAGLAAGFVDSIAGGGGLISLPVLLGFGLDAKTALGTSKLQSTFGAASAAWHYSRAGVVELKDCRRGFGITFVAGALGALTVQRLDPAFLKHFVLVLLVGVAIYSLLRPQLGELDAHPRMERVRFDWLFGMLLGFYDGFFGPGTGTFWAMAFVVVAGFNLPRATAYTKIMNLASNVSALAFFIRAGQVVYWAGLVMGIGQWLGARLGSGMAVKKGARFIRSVFNCVVLAIVAKLIYDLASKTP